MASKKVEKRAKIKRRIRKNVFGTSASTKIERVSDQTKKSMHRVINDVDGSNC